MSGYSFAQAVTHKEGIGIGRKEDIQILFCTKMCCQGLPFGENDHYKHRSSQLEQRHKKWAMLGRASGGRGLCYAFDSPCKNTSAFLLPLKMIFKKVRECVPVPFLNIFTFFNHIGRNGRTERRTTPAQGSGEIFTIRSLMKTSEGGVN